MFVQDVIAAITTAPSPSSNSSPSSATRTPRCGGRGAADGDGVRLGLRLAAGRLLGGRIARRERVGDRGVVRAVRERDAERAERLLERRLRAREGHAVLRPARACERRLDVAEVEPDDLRVLGPVRRLVPEQVLLAVRLDERDPLGAPAGEPEVVERRVVDREEAARRAVLGRHVPERRAVGDREAGDPAAEVLDELADDAGRAEELGHGQHEVGRRRALGQLAGQLEADDLRHEHRERLAEHRRLGFDPADAPAEHAEPVDHRRVRVGADERVRERDAVALLDDAREVLEVDLVADAGAGRHHLEVAERALAPAEEGVPLEVALELELDVPREREPRGELVDLDGVVDHELGRDQRVHARRIAAELGDRVPHRREVDDGRDAGEVLEQHAPRRERDLARRLGVRIPARDRVGVAAVPQHVLEQHPQRVRQPLDPGDAVDPLDRVRAAANVERRHGSK